MKILLVNNGNPAIIVERTKNKDIKVVHLNSGIHATYHPSGHNHFFDPDSTRVWRQQISEMGGHGGELVNCTQSLPFSKITKPEFFIKISTSLSIWKDKYMKLNKLEINTDKLISIELSAVNDKNYITLLDDEHPFVLASIF